MSGSGGDQLTPDEAKQVLHWLQRIERLRTLQPEDVTQEEVEAVNGEATSTLLSSMCSDFTNRYRTIPSDLVMRSAIAAVCRGVLRGGER